jgi:hypothetical protein
VKLNGKTREFYYLAKALSINLKAMHREAHCRLFQTFAIDGKDIETPQTLMRLLYAFRSVIGELRL